MTRSLWFCSLALCFALLGMPALHPSAHAAPSDVRAVTRSTVLHAEPDAAAPVVDRLDAGQQVRVLQTSADGRWLRIVRPDGSAWGYAYADALAAADATAAVAGADPHAGAAASGGGLFARSLGLAQAPGTPAVEAGAATVPAEGSLFGNQVLRGDIEAAHLQRREDERLAAIRQAEQDRARQQAEAQRRQREEQEHAAQAARERQRQQQREYEDALADAEADLARQRQWADLQSSIGRITQDMQRETDKTLRLMQDHARQQARQRREHEREQEKAKAIAQAQARARATGQAQASDAARARAEAQEAARRQAQAREAARAQARLEQERARQRAQADARQRAAALTPSFQAMPPGLARPPAQDAPTPVRIARAPQAAPTAATRPQVAASGTSGAGIRLAAVRREPGDGQPGRGSMRKDGLHVGGCAVASIEVDWSLGVLMGEATVMGTYTWQGDADCRLPISTVVLLRLDAPGLPGGWLALSPVVPRAGERGFNVTGSPARSALLCQYDDARRGECLSADAARDVWTGGQVSDFVVAW